MLQRKVVLLSLLFLLQNLPLAFASQELVDAAAAGDTALVGRLLQLEGTNVNFVGLKLRTPLKAAAENGHDVVVQQLLEAGATVGDENEFQPAVALAAESEHYSTVQILKTAGAFVSTNVAVLIGDDEIFKSWLNNPSNELTREVARFAVFQAAGRGHKNILQLLIDYKAELDLPFSIAGMKLTPLMIAVMRKKFAIVNHLIDAKVNVNQVIILEQKVGEETELHQCTALHLAVILKSSELINLLLQAGAVLTEEMVVHSKQNLPEALSLHLEQVFYSRKNRGQLLSAYYSLLPVDLLHQTMDFLTGHRRINIEELHHLPFELEEE